MVISDRPMCPKGRFSKIRSQICCSVHCMSKLTYLSFFFKFQLTFKQISKAFFYIVTKYVHGLNKKVAAYIIMK